MELNVGHLRMVIDEENGAITRMENKATGLVHIDSNPNKILFRITVPQDSWTSRYVDNHFARPEIVSKSDTEIVMRWNNLPAENGATGICAEVRFYAEENTGEVRFALNIINDGPDRITEIFAPVIAGWTGLGGKGADNFVLGGSGSSDPHCFPKNLGYTYAKLCQRGGHVYPVELYAPWVDLSGPGGGISLVHYMSSAQNISFFNENTAGYADGFSLAFGWQMPCIINPGKKWSSAPIGISLHNADWHATADRYVNWMDTWFTPPPAKKNLREIIGFQNVFLRSFDGTPTHELDTIPQIAAAGRKYGVDQLCLWDEVSMGNYGRTDTRDLLEYSPEEKHIIKRTLKQAREEGTNVNALINFRLFPSNPHFMEKYGANALRLLEGSLHTENYSISRKSFCGWARNRGPNCCIHSPFASNFRDWVLSKAQEYLDLGFVSLFYDQPFETKLDYGRLTEGCHPEETYAAVISLLKEIRQKLTDNNPDAYIIGEFCEAFMSQYIDLWMSWYVNPTDALHAAYSIPQTMHSWVVDNNAAHASRSFAMGMYLCLCTHGNESTLADVPEFGEHVARLAALRKRCAERTVHARFRDNQGIAVKTNNNAEAYAFDSAAGPAVIVTALEEKAAITVEVDRSLFSNPGAPSAGKVINLDGSEKETSGDIRHFELAPNEVAVWTL